MYHQSIAYFNGNSSILLIFHGIGSTPYEMSKIGRWLSDILEIDVLIPNMKNHVDTLKNFNPEEALLEGKNIIREYVKKYDKVYCIGNSFGTCIIQSYFEDKQANKDIEGIILTGTGGHFRSIINFSSILFESIIPIKYIRVPHKIQLTGHLEKEYILWKKKEFAKILAKIGIEAIKLMKKNLVYQHNITTPTLVINGLNDPVTHNKATEWFLENIQSPHKFGLKLKYVRHSPYLSYKKEIVYEYIKNFIIAIKNKDFTSFEELIYL